MIEIKDQMFAQVRLLRDVSVLDLRGNGAMRAGSVAALAKVADRKLSQDWSRYFYNSCPQIEGILFYNAHNDEEAVALYERAEGSLEINFECRLDNSNLRPHILQAALDNNLIVSS